MPDDPLLKLRSAFRGLGVGSRLYQWLRDQYHVLILDQQVGRRVNWIAAAEAANAAGIKVRGGPVTPKTMRRTWNRVVQDAKTDPPPTHLAPLPDPPLQAVRPAVTAVQARPPTATPVTDGQTDAAMSIRDVFANHPRGVPKPLNE